MSKIEFRCDFCKRPKKANHVRSISFSHDTITYRQYNVCKTCYNYVIGVIEDKYVRGII